MKHIKYSTSFPPLLDETNKQMVMGYLLNMEYSSVLMAISMPEMWLDILTFSKTSFSSTWNQLTWQAPHNLGCRIQWSSQTMNTEGGNQSQHAVCRDGVWLFMQPMNSVNQTVFRRLVWSKSPENNCRKSYLPSMK